MPGVYHESPFVVPTLVSVGTFAPNGAHDSESYSVLIYFKETQGTMVQLGTASNLFNISLQRDPDLWGGDIANTGPFYMVDSQGFADAHLIHCYFQLHISGTYETRILRGIGNTLLVQDCGFLCEFSDNDGSVMAVAEFSQTLCTIMHSSLCRGGDPGPTYGVICSGGQTQVGYCRFGNTDGGGFPIDLVQSGEGVLAVAYCSYKTSQGVISHVDRFKPSVAAVREAPSATDTPTINKGASAQTADLEQWQSSAAAVLASVSPAGIYRGAGVQLPHVINKVASANIRNSHDAEATSASATYVKAKTITLTDGLVGQARFLFDLKTSNTLDSAYGQIYRNGVALGTEQTDLTGAYVTKSQDITQTWGPGDTAELWIHNDGTHITSVQNFRIAYDDAPTVVVASANT